MPSWRISAKTRPDGEQKTVGIRFGLPVIRFGRVGTSCPSGIRIGPWWLVWAIEALS
jgi:hypothetical protein